MPPLLNPFFLPPVVVDVGQVLVSGMTVPSGQLCVATVVGEGHVVPIEMVEPSGQICVDAVTTGVEVVVPVVVVVVVFVAVVMPRKS